MSNAGKHREKLSDANRIVVKVGTTCLTGENSRLDISKVEKLAKDLMEIVRDGREAILVSSGAIGAGLGKLSLRERPKDMEALQAASTVGQSALMEAYSRSFKYYDQQVAQVLLTQEDFTDPTRFKNFKNTLKVLFNWGVIPIINENDAVAVEEIRMGDNDLLSAFTAMGADVDLLIILSDVDGLYTKDPKKEESAEPIRTVEEVTSEIEELTEKSSERDFGGMITKVQAAKKVTQEGIPVLVVDGSRSNVLKRVIEGEEIGTLFLPMENKKSGAEET